MAMVYMAQAPNGKKYIGFTTKSLKERARKHQLDAENHRTEYAFHRAIRKYGFSEFHFKPLVIGSKEYCLEIEKRCIDAFGTILPNGYNATHGGDGLDLITEEVIKRRSASIKKTLSTGDGHRKRLEEIRALHAREGFSDLISKGAKRKISEDSEYRENLIKNVKRLTSDPEINAKRIRNYRLYQLRKKHQDSGQIPLIDLSVED